MANLFAMVLQRLDSTLGWSVVFIRVCTARWEAQVRKQRKQSFSQHRKMLRLDDVQQNCMSISIAYIITKWRPTYWPR